MWGRLRHKYSVNAIAKHLPSVAYRFSKGPWRMLWIKFGYDPREDRNAGKFQIIQYRPPSSAKESINARKQVEQQLQQQRRQLPDTNFERVPLKTTTMYQLCDVAESNPGIADIVGRAVFLEKCHDQTGWYSKLVMDQIKVSWDVSHTHLQVIFVSQVNFGLFDVSGI